MMQGEIFRDSNGSPRARFVRPFEAAGWFLEDDVQSSVSTCDYFLSICEQVAKGLAHWEGTGNSHTVVVGKEGVTITNEFAENSEECHLSLEEFKELLNAWRQLVKT